MAIVTKKCDTCGEEYQGHHNSKRCDACKAGETPTESYAKDVGEYKDSLQRSAIVDAIVSIGSDVVVEVACEPTAFDLGIPPWPEWIKYGMCEDGYEVFPGWVWSQKKLVCVGGDAPREVIEMMQDAFQRRVINRKPVLGDADYGSKEKSS